EPSFSMERERKPPPGATITAVPVDCAGSGRYGVSVAMVTLRAKFRSYWRYQPSDPVAPGRGPVPSTIPSCWAGVGIGVILSFCACAGVAMAQAKANAITATRPQVGRVDADLAIFNLRFTISFRRSAIDQFFVRQMSACGFSAPIPDLQ